MFPRKRDDHKGRKLWETVEGLPCGVRCLIISIAFWQNLEKINVRYLSFGISAQLTVVLVSLP